MSAVAPTVSVILPTCNRPEFLRIAVASVFGQTFTDWELIIADDGSNEATLEYLSSLEAEPKIKVLRLTHMGNPARARNAAFREARGSFVAFFDSDDVWMPTKIAKQLVELRNHPECRWCYTAFLRVDEVGNTLPEETARRWVPHAGDIFPALVGGSASVRTQTVLADRAFVHEMGAFDETMRVAGDHDLWLRLALRSHAALVNEPLVHIRRHTCNHGSEAWAAAFVDLDRSLQALERSAPAKHRAPLRHLRIAVSINHARAYVQHDDLVGAVRTILGSSRLGWHSRKWWGASCGSLARATRILVRRTAV